MENSTNQNQGVTIENQFKRATNKMAWVAVIIVVLLAGIFLIYKWPFTKSAVFPSDGSLQNLILNIDSNNPLELFYYTANDSSKQNTQYKIFKVSSNLEKSDINTHTFTIAGPHTSVITDSWKKNIILFVTNSETQSVIYSLDVSSQNSQPQNLLTISFDSNKGDRVVSSAKFVDDGNALAFITTTSGDFTRQSKNPSIDIVHLNDPQKKETYQLKMNSKVTRFHFLEATHDSKIIYLSESGGSIGSSLSQWYKVDRATNIVQKLEALPPVPKGTESTDEGRLFESIGLTFRYVDSLNYSDLSPIFSPDRAKLAYSDFSGIVEQGDIEQKYSEGYVGRCLTSNNTNLLQKYATFGGTVMVHDLNTGATNEVFRNLSLQNNYCMNVGNRIISIKWLDNSRLAFVTIDGVYTIDVNTKQQQTLFTFKRTNNPGQQTRPSILSVQLPFIVFSDNSIVQTSTNKQLELSVPEGQNRYFFTFE